VHGVVRWRLKDLVQWLWDEFRIAGSETTLGRELRALGYRKLSARPRHHGQPEGAIGDLKKGLEVARERGVEPSARFYRLRNRLDSWELDRLDRTQANAAEGQGRTEKVEEAVVVAGLRTSLPLNVWSIHRATYQWE
jgi:hypothetical protein